jgi:hypothetical protein
MRTLISLDDFKTMSIYSEICYLEKLEYLEKLGEFWDDTEPKYYSYICNRVGLDYHPYDDHDQVLDDIKAIVRY